MSQTLCLGTILYLRYSFADNSRWYYRVKGGRYECTYYENNGDTMPTAAIMFCAYAIHGCVFEDVSFYRFTEGIRAEAGDGLTIQDDSRFTHCQVGVRITHVDPGDAGGTQKTLSFAMRDSRFVNNASFSQSCFICNGPFNNILFDNVLLSGGLEVGAGTIGNRIHISATSDESASDDASNNIVGIRNCYFEQAVTGMIEVYIDDGTENLPVHGVHIANNRFQASAQTGIHLDHVIGANITANKFHQTTAADGVPIFLSSTCENILIDETNQFSTAKPIFDCHRWDVSFGSPVMESTTLTGYDWATVAASATDVALDMSAKMSGSTGLGFPTVAPPKGWFISLSSQDTTGGTYSDCHVWLKNYSGAAAKDAMVISMGTGGQTYGVKGYIPCKGRTSIRTATYRWTSTGSGSNEYYLELAAGGDPKFTEPWFLYENYTYIPKGTMGSLAAGEWDYGDPASLGYDTIVVRLTDNADPDSKASGYIIILDAGDLWVDFAKKGTLTVQIKVDGYLM